MQKKLIWLVAVVVALLVGELWLVTAWEKTKKVVISDKNGEVETGHIVMAAENEISEKMEFSEEAGEAGREIIRKYLEKFNSPLLPYADMIYDLSNTYGYEYYWIVAIGQQESNLCKKIPKGTHNCWGYGIHHEGTLGFESYEEALKSYAEYLKREYFDKGYDTPEKIMKKYCPLSNGSWAFGVNKFINQLKTGNF